jgi:hypothetical protein
VDSSLRSLHEDDKKVSWKLRIISSSSIAIKNDTEKEDRQSAIKAQWEPAQPGRALKARKARHS